MPGVLPEDSVQLVHCNGATLYVLMIDIGALASISSQKSPCYTAPTRFRKRLMLPPKALLDVLSSQASRLLSGDNPLPREELESQLKLLLQGAFSKLDLVSREEFDSQMVVLARTRARLEALEARVADMESRSAVESSTSTE